MTHLQNEHLFSLSLSKGILLAHPTRSLQQSHGYEICKGALGIVRILVGVVIAEVLYSPDDENSSNLAEFANDQDLMMQQSQTVTVLPLVVFSSPVTELVTTAELVSMPRMFCVSSTHSAGYTSF